MKVPFSTQIPGVLKRQTAATVAGMKRDVDAGYSLSQLVTDALTAHIALLEQRHHGGTAWRALGGDKAE